MRWRYKGHHLSSERSNSKERKGYEQIEEKAGLAIHDEFGLQCVTWNRLRDVLLSVDSEGHIPNALFTSLGLRARQESTKHDCIGGVIKEDI